MTTQEFRDAIDAKCSHLTDAGHRIRGIMEKEYWAWITVDGRLMAIYNMQEPILPADVVNKVEELIGDGIVCCFVDSTDSLENAFALYFAMRRDEIYIRRCDYTARRAEQQSHEENKIDET